MAVNNHQSSLARTHDSPLLFAMSPFTPEQTPPSPRGPAGRHDAFDATPVPRGPGLAEDLWGDRPSGAMQAAAQGLTALRRRHPAAHVPTLPPPADNVGLGLLHVPALEDLRRQDPRSQPAAPALHGLGLSFDELSHFEMAPAVTAMPLPVGRLAHGRVRAERSPPLWRPAREEFVPWPREATPLDFQVRTFRPQGPHEVIAWPRTPEAEATPRVSMATTWAATGPIHSVLRPQAPSFEPSAPWAPHARRHAENGLASTSARASDRSLSPQQRIHEPSSRR